MTGRSKAAGTLKRVARPKRVPERKMFLKSSFLVKRITKAAMIGPIIKISALTIFPSSRGRVVRSAKITVEAFWNLSLLGKRAEANFQKRIMVATFQKARAALNQKT